MYQIHVSIYPWVEEDPQEYFLLDADAMSSLSSVSFFPDRWHCFSYAFLGERFK